MRENFSLFGFEAENCKQSLITCF